MKNSALTPTEWNLIMECTNAYIKSDSLYAACELDLFSTIKSLDIPNLENIAEKIDCSEYATEILLLGLCCTNLISKDRDSNYYFLSTAAEKALCKDENNDDSCIPFVKFNRLVQQKGMDYYVDSLKSSNNKGLSILPGNEKSLYARLQENEGMTEIFQSGMASYSIWGPKIVPFRELDMCNKLLDIGGGSGSVAKYMIEHFPNLEVKIMDIKQVCDVGNENTKENDNISFIEGNIFEDDWNEDKDSILFSHLLEIFSEDKVKILYKKAFDSLPVGGRLFVWTITSNNEVTGSLQAAKSSSYFLNMASGEGRAYTPDFHLKCLHESGFIIENTYERPEFDHTGYVAIKG